MDDPLSIVGVAAIALAIGAVFLLSLAEASLLSVSEVTVRRLVERGDRRAAAVERLRSNDDYLSAIIVGVNLSVILISTVMTLLVKKHLGAGSSWQQEAWHVGAIAVILVVAELTPKTWGAVASERMALRVARPMERLSRLAAPVVQAVTRVGNLFVRGVGPEGSHRRIISSAEVQAAADIGQEEGLVQPEEAEMLGSVIELGETTAREIMVPRVDIVAVPRDVTVEECVRIAVESGHSRIPVYEESKDRIIGILYLTDLLRELRHGQRDVDIAALAREPVFVPETKRVGQLFRELRDKTVHLAVVLDEFGGTEGLVTIEDILEELVGDIEDEHDLPEEDIVVLSPTEALVDGKTRITEVNERLAVHLPEEEYETLGGLVAGRLEHMPQVGERLQAGDAELVVEHSDRQYVAVVRVIRADREAGED